MAKDPAFLFYPNDYIGGTMGMTFEEKGAYMDLLMMQFNQGHMGGHMVGQVVGQLWVKIQHKFIKDSKGLYYNKRLEEEQNRRKRFTDSRKNNIKGKNQHTKNGGHTTSHMENENENENTSKDVSKNKDKKHKYGEYKNILLKDSEIKKLNERFGEDQAKVCIKELDEGIELKGYKYKSHYLAILKWANNEIKSTKKGLSDEAKQRVIDSVQ